MSDTVVLSINGVKVEAPRGATVVVALMIAGQHGFRKSVSGEPRGPLCGMGVCFECRATIDGVEQCRSCQVVCLPGMEVNTA